MPPVTISKASDRDTARKIHRLADSYVPRFQKVYPAQVKRLRASLVDSAIDAALDRGITGQPVELYAAVDELAIAKEERPEVAVYSELLVEGAKIQGVVLDLKSPFVLDAAKRLTANLVTQVSQETKRAIRQVIFEAVLEGKAPAVAKRDIRRIIGLTRRDALAVLRYPRPQGAERYAQKLLNRRALTIARTETQFAANRGQQLAWKEMARDNLIDTSRLSQRWLTTASDRTCDLCAPMNGQIVSLGSSFTSSERGVLPSARVPYDGGVTESPPLHPSCRCCLVADYGE